MLIFFHIDGRLIHNEDPDGEDFFIDLGSVLIFTTGADHVPPVGFGVSCSPEIRFEKENRLPHASTCGPTLYLPLRMDDPDKFSQQMDFAICNAHGYGKP